ncbi:MAG: DUF2190 family protein [Puniceicoccales bacterium]|jgi:hypothetical protein|nr:DUF2190 family protein [Puniceicoccales bacterium]
MISNFFIMDTLILSNSALGTHEDCITKYAKTAISPRRLVVLDTTDPDQIIHATANSLPFGVTDDEAAAGEIVNVDLLGCSNTIKIAAGAAIEAGALLIAGADGKVLPLPTDEGNYICIGLALSGASSGGDVEVLTSLPYPYEITE